MTWGYSKEYLSNAELLEDLYLMIFEYNWFLEAGT